MTSKIAGSKYSTCDASVAESATSLPKSGRHVPSLDMPDGLLGISGIPPRPKSGEGLIRFTHKKAYQSTGSTMEPGFQYSNNKLCAERKFTPGPWASLPER